MCQGCAYCVTLWWQGCYNVLHITCAPASPTRPQGYPPMVIDWTFTTGLIPCQVQPKPTHEPSFPHSRYEPQEKHQSKGIEKYISQSFMYVQYALLPLSTFKCACQWLLTSHLLLDLYHARFIQDLHRSHGCLQWVAGTRKHKMLWDGCSWVLNRTWFQICSSWYLSMFVFRDRSSSLMNITSF